ncbi:MAG: hypothetical protein QXY92_06715 [Archaeoglobaceae archaeon]
MLKVEPQKWLAEKFREYVAEKYGLRKGALSKAVADLIEQELKKREGSVHFIVGLSLFQNFLAK